MCNAFRTARGNGTGHHTALLWNNASTLVHASDELNERHGLTFTASLDT
jgi:hypothetical protein